MTKVKQIIEKTFQGNVTGHSIVLDDNTIGYLDDKGSEQGIKEGDEVTFTLAVKKNKQGKDYNLLTLKRASTGTPSEPAKEVKLPSGEKKLFAINPIEIFHERCRAITEGMKLTMEAVIADKINLDKVKDQFKEINDCLQDAISDITSQE